MCFLYVSRWLLLCGALSSKHRFSPTSIVPMDVKSSKFCILLVSLRILWVDRWRGYHVLILYKQKINCWSHPCCVLAWWYCFLSISWYPPSPRATLSWRHWWPFFQSWMVRCKYFLWYLVTSLVCWISIVANPFDTVYVLVIFSWMFLFLILTSPLFLNPHPCSSLATDISFVFQAILSS